MSLPHDQRPPDQAGTEPGTGVPHGARVATRRLSGLWVVLTSGAVVLLLLLIFILENSEDVNIAYFGVHGTLPLGVALLLAAIFGVLLVVIPGAGRILQLRRAARHDRTRPATPPADR